jgi:hypothetical protein
VKSVRELRAIGVDYGQGFAIARPVAMTETVAELPVYATRVAYGRELDGLLREVGVVQSGGGQAQR